MTTYPISKTFTFTEKIKTRADGLTYPDWEARYANPVYQQYSDYLRENQVYGYFSGDKFPARVSRRYDAVDLSKAQVVQIPTIVEDRLLTQYGADETTYEVVIDLRWWIVTTEPTLVGQSRLGECVVLAKAYAGTKGFATEAEAAKYLKRWIKTNATENRDEKVIAPYRDEIARIARVASPLLLWSAPNENTVVGDKIVLKGHGKIRAAVVIDFTKTRVKVAYTTPNASTQNPNWVPVVTWVRRSRPVEGGES